MDLLEELKALGVNVDEGLDRMMGNASLYAKMLGSFLNMMKNSPIDTDFNCDDYEDMIEKTHAVKGASGNLSLTPIYKGYTEVVDLLRAKQPEQAKEVLKNLQPIQADILNCIEKHS